MRSAELVLLPLGTFLTLGMGWLWAGVPGWLPFAGAGLIVVLELMRVITIKGKAGDEDRKVTSADRHM